MFSQVHSVTIRYSIHRILHFKLPDCPIPALLCLSQKNPSPRQAPISRQRKELPEIR